MLKVLSLLILFTVTLNVFAAELEVLSLDVAKLRRYQQVKTQFITDEATGDGSVLVKLYDERWIASYGYSEHRIPVLVHEQSAKVEGLYREGETLVFRNAEENVDCGTYGVGRVLRRPTLYLSGKCDVSYDHVKVGAKTYLKVYFTTK